MKLYIEKANYILILYVFNHYFNISRSPPNTSLVFDQTQPQYKIEQKHLDFYLLRIVGDIKTWNAGLLQRRLLVAHFLIQMQNEFHVLVPQLLRVLQLHERQNVAELLRVLNLVHPNRDFICWWSNQIREQIYFGIFPLVYFCVRSRPARELASNAFRSHAESPSGV